MAANIKGMEAQPQAPAPQILPPEGMEPRPARRQVPIWHGAPVTHILVAINVLVFVAMVARGISFWMPTPDQLAHWGGTCAADVLAHGQWWRIVTSMFVHVGIIHLATNMWCLWNLGLLAEPLLGSYGIAAAYLLTGAAGALLSTLFNFWAGNYYTVGAGASGAVFGLAGVLIILLKSPLLPLERGELKKLRRSVIYFAGINLLIGLGSFLSGPMLHVSIDNAAHVGGFGCGLLMAVPMVPRIGAERRQFIVRRRMAVGMMVLLLVLFGFYLTVLTLPPQAPGVVQ